MLRRQFRDIGIVDALVVIALAAGITFGALNVSGVADGDAPTVSTSATGSPAQASPAGTQVETSVPPVTTATSTTPTPAPKTTATNAVDAPAAADRLRRDRALRRAIGQQIIAAFSGRQTPASLVAAVRAGRVGGVILFGENIESAQQVRALTHDLQVAAAAGGNPRLFVMTDQEGGTVRRLQFAPPAVSARQIGQHPAPGRYAREVGAATGRGLRQVGVNVDLAPVADVPASAANFLGTRAFGRDAVAVSTAACGFSDGLRESGVVPTLKHFPGLGDATTANTDFAPVHIDAPLATLERNWAPYRRCAAGGLVMLSNASYGSLTGRQPAVLSGRAVRALRDIGFRGLTITDSLAAKALDAFRPLAVTVARAGADLQLYQSEGAASTAFSRLLQGVRDGVLHHDDMLATAERIRRAKTALRPTG